jgi:hypothetical protein
MKKPTFLIWLMLCLVVAASGTFALYNFGSTRTRFEAINSYYAKLLERRELKGVSGSHYWRSGEVFWIGKGHVKRSKDLGATSVDDIALPETFKGPGQSFSETILADQAGVYLRQGDHFKKVLDNFRCWYVCGSRLQTGDFVVGEYGSRIYYLDARTGQTSLLFTKPPETRHFHFAAVDPFMNDIYTSLGDAHKSSVTGIMRSQDGGKTWQWLDKKTKKDPRDRHRQPTAVYFDNDVVYFGADNRPQGIFILDRQTGHFNYVFVMDRIFKSWFTAITKAEGSFWALSRSFTDPPTPSFGLLWWSREGKDWVPIQTFSSAPLWLQTDNEKHVISVGFVREDANVIAFELPDPLRMAEWVRLGPTITLLDRLLEELRGPLEHLMGWSLPTRPPSGT